MGALQKIGVACKAANYMPPPAGKEPQTLPNSRDEVDGLEAELNTLHGEIEHLEQRLVLVLTPTGPDTDDGEAMPSQLSPMVQTLRINREKVRRAIDRIQRIANRVEL